MFEAAGRGIIALAVVQSSSAVFSHSDSSFQTFNKRTQ